MLAVVRLVEVITYINVGGYECQKVVLKEREYKFIVKNQFELAEYIKMNFPNTCNRRVVVNFYK
jgi:hypothetical protein